MSKSKTEFKNLIFQNGTSRFGYDESLSKLEQELALVKVEKEILLKAIQGG